jgi:flagellar motor component MotA
MTNEITLTNYPNAYIAWCACLYFILNKIRREGLMSIEDDIENTEKPSSIFQMFPQTLDEPYLEFATDIFRITASGNLNAEELQVYADTYIAGLLKNNMDSPDESLLRMIWLTIWANLRGYSPSMSIEFARQAIPIGIKPGCHELETLCKDVGKRQYPRTTSHLEFRAGGKASLDAAAEDFIKSLSGTV